MNVTTTCQSDHRLPRRASALSIYGGWLVNSPRLTVIMSCLPIWCAWMAWMIYVPHTTGDPVLDLPFLYHPFSDVELAVLMLPGYLLVWYTLADILRRWMVCYRTYQAHLPQPVVKGEETWALLKAVVIAVLVNVYVFDWWIDQALDMFYRIFGDLRGPDQRLGSYLEHHAMRLVR